MTYKPTDLNSANNNKKKAREKRHDDYYFKDTWLPS